MSDAITASDRATLLQTFVHIVETGSLSAAARRLGTTQPTVSRRLQALERQLGVPLLKRSTHATAPTDEGLRCYERARELLAHLERFDCEMRGPQGQPEGLLRVVVPHAFGQSRLIEPLAAFLRQHPGVSVEWLLHDRTPDFVVAGIDCAIHVGEVGEPDLVAIRLSDVPRIVVAAPSVLGGQPKPTHPDGLAALPWIALRTYYRDEIVLAPRAGGAPVAVPIRPRLATDSLYALRSAALLGLGVAVGSAWLLADDLAQGRLVQLVEGWEAAPLPVHLVYPHARFYPARLRRFVDFMKAAVPAAIGPAA